MTAIEKAAELLGYVNDQTAQQVAQSTGATRRTVCKARQGRIPALMRLAAMLGLTDDKSARQNPAKED